MKKIRMLLIGLFCWGSFLQAQHSLSLSTCIRLALENKPSIETLVLQEKQANLSLQEVKAKWWPEISVMYNYRYNPIVATTIIPIGQFNVNHPTNDTRGIKMGTAWQQYGGVTVSQPLIDFSIGRSIKKGKLKHLLAQTNLKIGEEDLIYEVAQSYLDICNTEELLRTSVNDTLRTYTTLQKQEALFKNEKLLITDLNRARINHNNALNQMSDNRTLLVTEKIYLAFLTALPADSVVLEVFFDNIQAEKMVQLCIDEATQPDSLHLLRKLKLEKEVILQDLKLAKTRNIPTLSLDGFLGANQFSEKLSPFKKNSWYGSSYIGITFQLPILYQENRKALYRRLRLQILSSELEYQEQRDRYAIEAEIALQKLLNTREEIEKIRENKRLYEESLQILSLRFSEMRTSAFDLNLEELEFLKLQLQLRQKMTELILNSLDYLKNTGLLYLLKE